MAKKSAANQRTFEPIFAGKRSTRRRGLFLQRILREEASKAKLWGPQQDEAHEVLKQWAQMELDGHLNKKETSLDAQFLNDIFSSALGYRFSTQHPEDWELEREFTVPGIGAADGALGRFKPHDPSHVVAVIELKPYGTDLDRDKFNGRTAVQQCWDYLNALPRCPWGIVSNFATIRLYHRNQTPLAYEEFHLSEFFDQAMSKGIHRFRQFYYLFERGGLLPTGSTPPRALTLLQQTETRQREVGDKLYDQYSDHRYRLIAHVMKEHGKPQNEAIHIAQKILDRIIFIAFCEDRDLLPSKSLEKAWKDIPPFSRVTNPRWQNFRALFEGVDKGHKELNLPVGYNGGLFAADETVDNLQLADDWTQFFKTVGDYDFRDEVNVDVLGHLFERSISELEKYRAVGLFSEYHVKGNGGEPAMKKSAERKRFGIYYTPQEFTKYIVNATVRKVAEERLGDVRAKHGLSKSGNSPNGEEAPPEFWLECLDVLRQITVCDPACGSGAFLIQAYDVFEEFYVGIYESLMLAGVVSEDQIDEVPDMILRENLYGVDLSEQAVEITQLALWIRSARRGRTLADLSHNIVCHNSLVTDPQVDQRAAVWHDLFPTVFDRKNPGFDCVIGNPPWERLKLQEREFFAFRAPKIAGSVSAADRRKRIAKLSDAKPHLLQEYEQAKGRAEKVLAHVRSSGEFPMCAKGDVNTYALFAELASKLVNARGRVGLLVPSGIATDKTAREFFSTLMGKQRLIELHDFENRKKIFPDVDGRFKFSIFVFGGEQVRHESADFTFFNHQLVDLEDSQRHIALSRKDLKLLNPNSRTCPIFRSRTDAGITKGIYRRVPVLVDESRKEGGNPWGIRFFTMFHQTNDAELFHTAEQLKKNGFRLEDNRWVKKTRTFLPLYEAKMVQAYDHRAASVVVQDANWMRQGQTEPTTLVAHQNPEFTVTPRWWVDQEDVKKALKEDAPPFFIGFKDITSPTNQRTMIAAAIPFSGVTNHFPLLLSKIDARFQLCLLANLNSFALDYVARQKIGGVTLNFFIVEQLPVYAPDFYDQKCPWMKRQKLVTWISNRVLKLTCTANDMQPLAEAAAANPLVHKWDPSERAQLQAELDAAFFLLYGINREDTQYILSTFRHAGDQGPGMFDTLDTPSRILATYDTLSKAS